MSVLIKLVGVMRYNYLPMEFIFEAGKVVKVTDDAAAYLLRVPQKDNPTVPMFEVAVPKEGDRVHDFTKGGSTAKTQPVTLAMPVLGGPPAEPAPKQMTIAELKVALTDRDITFKANATQAQLYALYLDATDADEVKV